MRLAILAVLAVVLMFGCTSLMQSEGSSPASPSKGVSAPSYEEADYSGTSGQYITKEGYITIKVQEGTLETKFEDMKSGLEEEGATLGDVSYTEYSDRKQYSLSVKISPSKFDSVSAMLKDVGDVKSMSVQLEDVTKRYVELDTRIENREIELERLYELYNMSDNVSDLLQVEKEITRVETELELYKYEKQQLVSKVEKSTFYINLYEEKPATNQLSLTLEGLASMFFGAMSVAITVVVALLGFLLPIGFVVGVLWFAFNKLFGGRKGGPKPSEHKKIPLPD